MVLVIVLVVIMLIGVVVINLDLDWLDIQDLFSKKQTEAERAANKENFIKMYERTHGIEEVA